MRLFIAIGVEDLNFSPQMILKKLRVNLNRKGLEYRWLPEENYHITLNYLGEISLEKVEMIKAMLAEVSHRHVYFHLKLHGLGAFPEIKEGRVIWMDVQNSMALRALQEDCEARLIELGFSFEIRPYVPHLTLARLRNPRNLKDALSPLINQHFGEMAVKSLILYESRLGGAFPIYEPLLKFPLRERIRSAESIE
jgi:2'-5' RNA ligase